MYEQVRDYYLTCGFGGRVGFGERPAIVAIDMARSWMDESSPQGSGNVGKVLENIIRVLDAGRRANVPVFFTTMAFDPGGIEAKGPIGEKLPHLSKMGSLERGSPMVELDPRLGRRPDEPLIEKQRASAFWGTPFLSYLVGRKIDTLIVTGCSTSGCIRSTAESSHNENFHTIVAGDAVADRSALAHECNLIDIDMRFADVLPSDEIIDWLGRLG